MSCAAAVVKDSWFLSLGVLCFLFVLSRVELQVLVYGTYECFVMQMLYVCVLCASVAVLNAAFAWLVVC